MTEGMEDLSAGPAPSPGAASPICSSLDTGPVPEEKPEETEAAGESGEEGIKGIAEGGGGSEDERVGALGIVALPGTCCVCIEMEQINHCLHSEKICILPILACLLSLALCTAGIKWVFVDKIFEYEPPTHLDPKPIGQDPIIISVDPTLGITVSIPHSAPSTVSLTTTIAITPGHPEVFMEEKSTRGPHAPQSPRVTYPSVTLKYNAERPTVAKQTPQPKTTQEINNIIQTISTTSTSTTTKTSSHITRCSDSQKNYCVNGGECFTLEIMPGSTKFLCRCPNEFTGDRCQNYVMASFYKAEELYQKRILTITGICIALLVVGIMCVVAYCKTKKQRKKLHDRLRQSQRNKRKTNTSTGAGSNLQGSTTGRRTSSVPLQELKHTTSCNGMAMQHATEETESTFPTSKYASAIEPTTFTHISQRFESSTKSLTRLCSESQTAPTTPGSPPSEISAPLSSLAISVPSVALSPSVEEDRPLLPSNMSQPHMPSRLDEQKRNVSHYNHGHVAHSLPPSPVLTKGNVNEQDITDHDATAASHRFSTFPEKLINQTNNINDCSSKRVTLLRFLESSSGRMLMSETEAPRGGDASFLTADSFTDLWALDSSRTNPAAPNDDLQLKPSRLTIKQDPIAV
ncbi:pro-neuregulin-1, membrane-bound isoform [Xenentodon cancila]